MSDLKINPYEGINWDTVLKCRGTYHTHTTESDGGFYGSDVIKLYKDKGYKILFITDHDSYRVADAIPNENNHVVDIASYPWSIWEGTETLNYGSWVYSPTGTVTQPSIGEYSLNNGVVTFPDNSKMLTGKGSEYSRGHHVNMFFSGADGFSADEDGAIANVQSSGGMAIINHPSYPTLNPLSWFSNLYNKYPVNVLPGIEVFNGSCDGVHGIDTDNRVTDRALWDSLLTELMPDRPVWGYSNDDMHGLIHIFKCYNHFLLSELTEQALKTAMTNGASFMSYDKNGNDITRLDYGEVRAPMINSIITTETEISIVAENYTTINWLYNGTIVGTGESFNFENYDNNYVRAEILGTDDIYTYTQPFGFENTSFGVPVPIINKYIKENNQWNKIDKVYCNQNGLWLESNLLKK